MKQFLDEHFLLHSETARRLYHESAAALPICDFHCHIDAAVLAANRLFRDLTDAWLGGDHYKWRAMRQAGVPERLITGSGDPEEKFLAWAAVMPDLIGNPLYHWTHLELQRYFAIDQPLTPVTAPMIWQKANDCLARPAWRPLELLRRLQVRILCTTDDPLSDLPDHDQLAGKSGDLQILPAFRPDRFLRLLQPEYPQIVSQLAGIADPTGKSIDSIAELADALRGRAVYFHQRGCRLSDHALDNLPAAPADRAQAEILFRKRLAGGVLTLAEAAQVQYVLLGELAAIYHDLGWTMQWHIGALRNTSSRSYARLGADAGYDAIQDQPVAAAVARLLNDCQARDQLPRTLLYSLNANDNMTLGALAGTFAMDGQTAWVNLGPAWWFHDQLDGMRLHIRQYSQVSVLANYIGMTTDSRSLLSYTRHEYFRRIFCNLLAEWVEQGEYPADWKTLDQIIKRVCWSNASGLFD